MGLYYCERIGLLWRSSDVLFL